MINLQTAKNLLVSEVPISNFAPWLKNGLKSHLSAFLLKTGKPSQTGLKTPINAK
jgi:hypothetical protein